MTRPAALELFAPSGLPMVQQGDDLVRLIGDTLIDHAPRDGDVVVVAQKIVSKAEGRSVEVASVVPSDRARTLAAEIGKDPRLVEIVLGESARVVRSRPNLLIVEHKLGFVMANAGVDQSNVAPQDGIARALLLPVDPDGSAEALRAGLSARFGAKLAVIINDSFGRAWRRGTAGIAIGAAGLPSLVDLRGSPRPVRPHAGSQRHRLRRRDRGRRLPADGPGGRGAARRAGARPDLDRARCPRGRPRASAGRGPVPVIVALSGGIGGAKLALGLSRVLPPEDLLIGLPTPATISSISACRFPRTSTP